MADFIGFFNIIQPVDETAEYITCDDIFHYPRGTNNTHSIADVRIAMFEMQEQTFIDNGVCKIKRNTNELNEVAFTVLLFKKNNETKYNDTFGKDAPKNIEQQLLSYLCFEYCGAYDHNEDDHSFSFPYDNDPKNNLELTHINVLRYNDIRYGIAFTVNHCAMKIYFDTDIFIQEQLVQYMVHVTPDNDAVIDNDEYTNITKEIIHLSPYFRNVDTLDLEKHIKENDEEDIKLQRFYIFHTLNDNALAFSGTPNEQNIKKTQIVLDYLLQQSATNSIEKVLDIYPQIGKVVNAAVTISPAYEITDGIIDPRVLATYLNVEGINIEGTNMSLDHTKNDQYYEMFFFNSDDILEIDGIENQVVYLFPLLVIGKKDKPFTSIKAELDSDKLATLRKILYALVYTSINTSSWEIIENEFQTKFGLDFSKTKWEYIEEEDTNKFISDITFVYEKVLYTIKVKEKKE